MEWSSDSLAMALKGAGLWKEAKSFEKDCRSAGMVPKAAWEAMRDRYGPLVAPRSDGRVIGAPAAEFTPEEVQAAVAAKASESSVAPRFSDVTPDQITRTGTLEEIVRWVGSNIRNERPDKDTCPDPEAWMLWEAYKGNPSRFVEQIWSKVRLGKDALGSQERMNDDGRAVVQLVDRLERILASSESATR